MGTLPALFFSQIWLCAIATATPTTSQETTEEAAPGLTYPSARRGEVVEDYHGTAVPDPYRWMEDPDAPETREWINAEVALTSSWLDATPRRDGIRKRVEVLWNYERFGIPFKRGDRYFFQHNNGLQDHSILYVVDDLDDAEAQVVLDPNSLSKDGTVSAPIQSLSEDGSLMAYGTSDGGSDWRTIHIRNVLSGRDLTESLHWVKFSSATWTHDNNGFYYSRYPEPENPLESLNKNHKIYYHEIATPQESDRLVYERPDNPDMGFGTQINDAGDTLFISVSQGTDAKNRLYSKDLTQPEAPVVKLFDAFDGAYYFLGEKVIKDERDGLAKAFGKKRAPTHRYWIYTNKDAPKGRVIAIDPQQPQEENWVEIIPEGEHVMEEVSLTGDRLIAKYLVDAKYEVKVFGLNGEEEGVVPLPDIGSAWGFGGKSNDPETFFAFSGFTSPTSIFRFNTHTREISEWKTPEVAFEPGEFVTKQVFYDSKDGTKVPMFLIHKKGLELNGDQPTVLYGYGGFNISLTPSFSVSRLAWLEMGGVFAIANLRGGGEYGEEWHDAGTKTQKQNVFDDFIAGAEWLIANDYTRPARLGIMGGSNGGLLVGACMTQRPELFGAAVPAVGVLDMLRYHKFTIGWAWADDYGTSEESPEMFTALHAYSPLHNLKAGTEYPPTMIFTADHDDRVVPAHSFKFAAQLQQDHAGVNPVLIRIETRAGHGGGMPVSMRMDLIADQYAFFVRALGMETDAEKATREPSEEDAQ
jgi:prolyl oligopeptidase